MKTSFLIEVYVFLVEWHRNKYERITGTLNTATYLLSFVFFMYGLDLVMTFSFMAGPFHFNPYLGLICLGVILYVIPYLLVHYFIEKKIIRHGELPIIPSGKGFWYSLFITGPFLLLIMIIGIAYMVQ